MSSVRYPGKVLAPINGKAVISQLLDRIEKVFPMDRVIVLTSDDVSDDPIVGFLDRLGVKTFRGSLCDVFDRFRKCLIKFECDWFFRISADSPLFEGDLVRFMSKFIDRRDVDIVTNLFPRSFPKGHSLEMIKSNVFATIDTETLTPDQKEHVTKVYYDNHRDYSIMNVHSGKTGLASMNFCVDTLEDLRRLERMSNGIKNEYDYSVELR